jgi:hypothetical protein
LAAAAGAASVAGAGGSAGAAGAGGSAGAAGAGGESGASNDAEVTYGADIQPILVQNCSPCHATLNLGQHNAAASYADAVRVAEDMVDEIDSGGMPPACDGGDVGDPGCVSEADFDLIEQWVDDDTPE